MEHKSVLLEESITMLDVKDDGLYVDCTLGRGGHSSAILKRCTHGHLYAFDLDQAAIAESSPILQKIGNNFTCIHQPFGNMKEVLDSYGIGRVDGIIMDLGVSSPQFDDTSRGFSYRHDARLDMRMNQEQELDAWTVVNEYSQEDLMRILHDYGEEPFAGRIASKIVRERERKPINTTLELADVIKTAVPAYVLKKKGHPAKQSFQAIRIEVNGELKQLEIALQEGLRRLKPGGRMCVITFHSLEDRMVKQTFRRAAVPQKHDRRLPVLGEEKLEYQLLNKKPITASEAELAYNNRAHSAKLRGIKRIGDQYENR
ncbi:16S rRNA (cytosine(1402)-N(4))-methyltransferase RsmH [Catenisphaera adipataccumulans]|uniref:Ribosomal RNA small subunit methyltransferase H n=1 Tax=Catenisphaera adipataccumulans TaxID=700500 RepID=A0A7W8CZP3_9FIRM|nr:16S rRNA (cytosine1402-N4)-methyltransferase [Catenisphaera adipataccumulans]